MIFLLLIGVCWFVTNIYTYHYNSFHFQHQSDIFNFYLSLSIGIIAANALAGNGITFILFYIAGLFIIYPLITMRQNKIAYKAGKVYLLSTIIPVVVVILPLLFASYYYGIAVEFCDGNYFNFRDNAFMSSIIIALLIIGLSKNSVFPFHYWLPYTSIAPTPVSALLHSVVGVLTGIFGLIKIFVYGFGINYIYKYAMEFEYTGWLFYLCSFTAIYTAYKAYKTKSLKKRFAYSTVGQLSYIITALLVGTPLALLGAILHLITHSFAKMCLFFIAGYFHSVHHTFKTFDIAQLASKYKWLVVCIALCGLSIAGFPLLAGYYSKDYILLEELHTKHYVSAIALLVGALINFFYILPIIKAGFFKKPITHKHNAVLPVPLTMTIAIAVCCIFIIVLSLFMPSLISLLHF